MAQLSLVSADNSVRLDRGWRLLSSSPGAFGSPAELPDDAAGWLDAPVPGTVASALHGLGRAVPETLEDCDHWYRLRLAVPATGRLVFDGLATLAEIWVDGMLLARSEAMFTPVAVEVSGGAEIALCFRALAPVLRARSRRDRARWRSALAQPGGLRHLRTSLLGRMPGWCPPVPAVGPWRPVRLERSGGALAAAADLHATLMPDGRGRLDLQLRLQAPMRESPARVAVDEVAAALRWTAPDLLEGRVELRAVRPWWPHTHGEPALHEVRVEIGGQHLALGRTGFRDVACDAGPDGAGFALRINGERVFCRGACWSSPDLVARPDARDAYRPWLEAARDAGMNMIRVGGTMGYEAPGFFELCDELGLMVWQDFMFANLDYPVGDRAFMEAVGREAEAVLDTLGAHPSVAVLCGGSEVAQQAAMLGAPRASWEPGPLFGGLLAEACARRRPDVPYLPGTPTGGALPFSANAGVAHYFGVGAYLRSLGDARRADVRFAAECLAFANIPDETSPAMPREGVRPAWSVGVPRDPGASWDFADVRDHYLREIFGVDPVALRRADPERYARLSRATVAEVMEAVFAEWRRAGSGCGGGLVWMLQDVAPGAGWGVLDAAGEPKSAWHGLRRAFRPVQLLLTDEGINGLVVHLLNETAAPQPGRLRIITLRAGRHVTAEAVRDVLLAPRSAEALPAAGLFDTFLDLNAAYRFGPAAHEVVVARLEAAESGRVLAEAFHLLPGCCTAHTPLGLCADLTKNERNGWQLSLRADRFARAVHIEDPHFRATEDWFHLVPGERRSISLVPRRGAPASALPCGEVRAVNGEDAAAYAAGAGS